MSLCILPGCKAQARIKFCSNKHKDEYHNWTNPRGKFAHLKDKTALETFAASTRGDYDHPFSSESLGQQ